MEFDFLFLNLRYRLVEIWDLPENNLLMIFYEVLQIHHSGQFLCVRWRDYEFINSCIVLVLSFWNEINPYIANKAVIYICIFIDPKILQPIYVSCCTFRTPREGIWFSDWRKLSLHNAFSTPFNANKTQNHKTLYSVKTQFHFS